MALTPEQYKQVKEVFDKRGIPEWVWLPIMRAESTGDPNKHALTSREDSRGLFQINVKAHPQWKDVNLYDPVTNAKIAAENFIAPALFNAGNQGLKSEGDIVSYVWHYGIKPQWTEEKNKTIREYVADFLKNGSGSLGGSSGAQPGASTVIDDVKNYTGNVIDNLLQRFQSFSWNLVPFLIGLVILIFTLKAMFLDSAAGLILGGKDNGK